MIYNGNTEVGCRLLNTDTCETLETSIASVKSVIAGKKAEVYNAKISGGELRGENGALSRYCKIGTDGKPLEPNKLPIVIINEMNLTHYNVSDFQGNVRMLTLAETLMLAKKFGIANGKVVSRDNREYISAISGYYPAITLNIKPQTIRAPEKPKKPEPKIEAPMQKSASVKVPDKPKETPTSKVEALTILKDYINKNQAKTILEYFDWKKSVDYPNKPSDDTEINDWLVIYKSSGNRGSDEEAFQEKILEQVVGMASSFEKLSTIFNIKLAEQVYKFTWLKIPYTKYLMSAMTEEISKSPNNTIRILFPDFESSIGATECNGDWDIYAKFNKMNIEFICQCKDTGIGDLATLAERLVYYKMMETAYTAWIETLTSSDDPSIVTSMYTDYFKILATCNRNQDIVNLLAVIRYDCEELFKVAIDYKDTLEDVGVNTTNLFNSDILSMRVPLNRIYVRGLPEVIQVYMEHLIKLRTTPDIVEKPKNTIQETQEISDNIISRTSESDLDWYKTLSSRVTILDKTDTNIAIANDLIKRYTKDSDLSWRQKYRLDRAIVMAEEAANGIGLIINDNGFSKAKSSDGVDKSNTDTKPNTKKKSSKASKKSQYQEQVENTTVELDSDPAVKKKCDYLISKADTVEMQVVLEQYPKCLLICHTVLRNSKVSDRQRARIEEAYNLLMNQ